jgi:hypothetical protein
MGRAIAASFSDGCWWSVKVTVRDSESLKVAFADLAIG